jgi:hypothetical protein
MIKVAIETNKEINFKSSVKGIVKIEVQEIIFDINTGYCILNIQDSCYVNQEVTDEDGNKKNIPIVLATTNIRPVPISSEKLDELTSQLSVKFIKGKTRQNIMEIFQQGLLLTTQSEVDLEGKCKYYTLPEDWIIVP